jgi:hypothetical protein
MSTEKQRLVIRPFEATDRVSAITRLLHRAYADWEENQLPQGNHEQDDREH